MTIHVVGNCTVDVFFRVQRFPEPGETLLADERVLDLGGKGANQAVVAARFGVPVRLAAPLGGDPEGVAARARLAAEGLPESALIEVEAATDQSFIAVVPNGENTIISSAAAARSLSPDAARTALKGVAAGDIVMVQGNLSLDATRAALETARDAGARTFVNPAPIQWDYASIWPLADIAVLNRIESRNICGTDEPMAALTAFGGWGVGLAVVTLGAEGAVALDGDRIIELPAMPVAAVDAAGAGDAFCGALAAGLALGHSSAESLRLAICAAAHTVGRPGTQSAFPTAAEAAALLAGIAGACA